MKRIVYGIAIVLLLIAGVSLLSAWQSGGMTYPAQFNTVVSNYCGLVMGATNGTYSLAPNINSSNVQCNHLTSTQTSGRWPFACTAKNLYVSASAAGAVSGSGVITLRVNGSNSSLTCTLGTGTTCNDSTHSVALALNDAWDVTVTTGQASDTTADVKANFACQSN